MADITPVVPAGRSVIQSYGEGRFRISGVIHEGSTIVLPDAVLPWPDGDTETVSSSAFGPILTAEPAVEILLLGTGPTMRPLSPELREELRRGGVVADAMDTGAACRTFNVLAAEDRRVAAALVAVP